MSRSTRKVRLQVLNTYDKERIIDENINNLIAFETEIMDNIDLVAGSVEENAILLRDVSDSMAEVTYLMSGTHFGDDEQPRQLGGPLYREGRD